MVCGNQHVVMQERKYPIDITDRILQKSLDWNGLPPSVFSGKTLNQFKNRLDRHWTQIAYTIPHEDG